MNNEFMTPNSSLNYTEGQTITNYPIRIEAEYPEQSSRLLALASILFVFPKAIILIPHFIILYLINIVAFIVFILGQFAVLFTGKYPKKSFNFVLGSLRWQTRVNAYFFGLTDKYPPFDLK